MQKDGPTEPSLTSNIILVCAKETPLKRLSCQKFWTAFTRQTRGLIDEIRLQSWQSVDKPQSQITHNADWRAVIREKAVEHICRYAHA
jgi:hypothetical protein